MRPFVSGTDADFEGLALLHGVDAALSQHTPMEEGVAGPIGEFDEPEPLLGVEPLNDPVDRGTGRVFERLAEPGSPVTLSGGERLFAVERCGDRVHDGGDAHRLLDRFLRDAGVLQRVVMRLDAGAAAVDR